MSKAIYPGSFDPLSNGHLDIITRATKIFDEVHIVISNNTRKNATFSVEERLEMIKKVTKRFKNVKVTAYDGLSVNYCKENDIKVLIRGLRNYQDYEAEFNLYQFNKNIDSSVETLLMLPSNKHIFVSSSAIKELIYFNADISPYVPEEIKEDIIKKYKK